MQGECKLMRKGEQKLFMITTACEKMARCLLLYVIVSLTPAHSPSCFRERTNTVMG